MSGVEAEAHRAMSLYIGAVSEAVPGAETKERTLVKQDLAIFVCNHCLSPDQSPASLEVAAKNAGPAGEIGVQTVPCSGKIDVIYMLRAFEGGLRGMAVITCPPGRCRNVEGAYRAIIRMGHAARLLEEVGLGSERLVILHAQEGQDGRDLPSLVEAAVNRLSALPANPVARPAETARME